MLFRFRIRIIYGMESKTHMSTYTFYILVRIAELDRTCMGMKSLENKKRDSNYRVNNNKICGIMLLGWQANQNGRGSGDAIWAASYGSRWRSRGLVNQERMFDVLALPVNIYIYIYVKERGYCIISNSAKSHTSL